MANKKTILISLIFLVITSAIIFGASQVQAQNFTYQPMEKIPGFESANLSDFPTLIQTIYRFALWAVGICALFMITVGGFSYMTSAGNTAKAGSGKQIIADALIGLILVFVAVLIFTVINPNITTVDLQITPGGGAPAAPTGTCNGSCKENACSTYTGATNGIGTCPNNQHCCRFFVDNCPGGDCTLGACTTDRPEITVGSCGDNTKKCCSLLKGNVDCVFQNINYSTFNLCSDVLPRSSCGTSVCSQYLPAINRYAGGAASANFLKALMVVESDCVVGRTSYDGSSFGLMQLQPATAKLYAGGCVSSPDVIDSNWLRVQENADASICIAANYARHIATTNCGSDPGDIYAGYNSGEWCKPSKDCATMTSCKGGAMKAWECPYDNPEHTVCNAGLYQTKQGASYIRYCMDHPGF